MYYRKWVVVPLFIFSRPRLTLFISFILSLSHFFSKLKSLHTEAVSHLRPYTFFYKVTSTEAGYRFGQVCLPVSWESSCNDSFPLGFSPSLTFQRWLLQQHLPLYAPNGKSVLAFIFHSKRNPQQAKK